MSEIVSKQTEEHPIAPEAKGAGERSLLEIDSLNEFRRRIGAIVDPSMKRGSLLFQHPDDSPIPPVVDIHYLYKLKRIPGVERLNEVTILHDPLSPGAVAQEKAKDKDVVIETLQLQVNAIEYAAVVLRDALLISGLKETTKNLRKMLDYIIRLFFRESSVSRDQRSLNSGNFKSIENAINHPDTRKNPVMRRGKNSIFDSRYALHQLGAKAIYPDSQGLELSRMDSDELILAVLRNRRQNDPENHLYERVHHPGLSFVYSQDGKRRKIDIFSLIRSYLGIARRVLLEPSQGISDTYNFAQIESALDQTLGRLNQEIDDALIREVKRSTLDSIDPIMIAALRELAFK